MPLYDVRYPIVGVVSVYSVEADSEKEAIEKAFDTACELCAGNEDARGEIEELNAVEHLTTGNTLNAPLNDAEAEEQK